MVWKLFHLESGIDAAEQQAIEAKGDLKLHQGKNVS